MDAILLLAHLATEDDFLGERAAATRFVVDGELGEPLFRSPAMFGSQTVVWSAKGRLLSASGAVLEVGSFVLKHSFI